MKKILFVAILANISSTPAYAAAVGNSASHAASHAAAGKHMEVNPSGAISNNAAKPHHRKKGQGFYSPQVLQDNPPRKRRHHAIVDENS